MWIIPIFYSSAGVYVAYINILQIFHLLYTILSSFQSLIRSEFM